MRFLIATAAAMAIVALAPASGQAAPGPQIFNVSPTTTVEIGTTQGDYSGRIDVHLIAWDQPHVSLRRVLRGVTPDDVTTDVEQTAAGISIHTPFRGRAPRARGLLGLLGATDWGRVSVSYELYVPAKSHVALHLANGSATVDGILGAIDGGTSNGDLTLNAVGGPLDLTTSNGDIRATLAASERAPSIHLGTSNGDITVER